MNPANEFNLPVFDRPMDEDPSPMTYEQAIASFEEVIVSLRLREKEILKPEVIEPFVME